MWQLSIIFSYWVIVDGRKTQKFPCNFFFPPLNETTQRCTKRIRTMIYFFSEVTCYLNGRHLSFQEKLDLGFEMKKLKFFKIKSRLFKRQLLREWTIHFHDCKKHIPLCKLAQLRKVYVNYSLMWTVQCRTQGAVQNNSWTGLEGSRRLRFPDFNKVGTWRW